MNESKHPANHDAARNGWASNGNAEASARDIHLPPDWLAVLADEFKKPYMRELSKFLVSEKQSRKIVYPAGSEIFAALNATPLDEVKVVILGQDPYHGPNQAHGLSFSVPPDLKLLPPSLINIFQEIQDDLGLSPNDFHHGCLESWARQGVLLLNSVLTVEYRKAGSHQGKGWEEFTDHIIEVVASRESSLVFLLWGSYAQKKGDIINRQQHLVLTAPHPSPLSASRGFFGCRHFSACNDHLVKNGLAAIDWRVPAALS